MDGMQVQQAGHPFSQDDSTVSIGTVGTNTFQGMGMVLVAHTTSGSKPLSSPYSRRYTCTQSSRHHRRQ